MNQLQQLAIELNLPNNPDNGMILNSSFFKTSLRLLLVENKERLIAEHLIEDTKYIDTDIIDSRVLTTIFEANKVNYDYIILVYDVIKFFSDLEVAYVIIAHEIGHIEMNVEGLAIPELVEWMEINKKIPSLDDSVKLSKNFSSSIQREITADQWVLMCNMKNGLIKYLNLFKENLSDSYFFNISMELRLRAINIWNNIY